MNQALSTYLFGPAEWRVKKLCPQRVGLSYEELTVFGKKHGLKRPYRREGITFMVETKSYGRWGCEVEMKDSKAVCAEYHFMS